MASLKRHEGYLLIDNRFSPGVSADFIRASGHEAPVVPEGKMFESATVTCSHCHTIVVLNPDRSRSRNHCRKCDHYICDNPACHVECKPLNAVLDSRQEAVFISNFLTKGG